MKILLLISLLLIAGLVVAEADLRIVGVSRIPDSDFYSAGQEIHLNVTMYNYGDALGNGRLEINATGNSIFQCEFLDVQAGFTQTAICQDTISIKNTTNLLQVNLYTDSGFSNKNLTLYSTEQFTKKTKVPDSNPIIIVALVLLTGLFLHNKKQKQ